MFTHTIYNDCSEIDEYINPKYDINDNVESNYTLLSKMTAFEEICSKLFTKYDAGFTDVDKRIADAVDDIDNLE